jgi:DNA-binding transcriptional MocR family regulator
MHLSKPFSSAIKTPLSFKIPKRMRIALSFDNMSSTTTAKPKKQINLLRGWPNPALLPTPALLRASQIALSDPSVSVPGLLYGPDPGYQPLREEIAKWMKRFYFVPNSEGTEAADADRICITGGASQNLACVLQVFSDPLKTRVWMVAPCYYLACRIFEDAGVLMNAVGEGKEGIDLEALEKGFEKCKREEGSVKVSWGRFFPSWTPISLLCAAMGDQGLRASRDGS